LAGCQQKQEVYAPVSGSSVKQKAAASQERAKNLNKLEREQIQDWIAGQKEKFYPTSMNYWVNRENFSEREKSPEETVVSYGYYISDLSGIQLYDQPKGYRDVPLSKFPTELTAVEDALKYMNPGILSAGHTVVFRKTLKYNIHRKPRSLQGFYIKIF